MLARQPTFSFPDFATTFRERKRLLSRSFVLFISPAHFQNFNCIIYSIKMMFQTKAVLYFLLCLNAVALFDVVDDCRDAAKEGTRQCQVWASNGEWYVSSLFAVERNTQIDPHSYSFFVS